MAVEESNTRFCQMCEGTYPTTNEFYYMRSRTNGSMKYRCRTCSKRQKKLRYDEKIHIPCAVLGCPNSISRKDKCSRHYREQLYGVQGGCRVEGCNKLVYVARGLCGMHYRRVRVHGDAHYRKTQARGKLTHQGYRQLHGYHGHPNANIAGAILEHRLVMSKILGRPLLPEEKVHHKNGQRADNRPGNLELWTISHPYGQRVEDVLQWAKSIVERYENLETNPLFSGDITP